MADPPEVEMIDLATRPDVGPDKDQELLEEARRQTGAASSGDVINTALQRLVIYERERRRRAYDNVQQMVAEGALDQSAVLGSCRGGPPRTRAA
jgi:hypothetical protein